MMEDNDSSDVKIVDFGLSKTFTPGETCKEPFGTLCYVAPEILLQRSYDKAVDLWSLGVIMHLMLSGTLPFDDKDDREIAKKTIYQEVTLSHPNWDKVSDDAKDLVLSTNILLNLIGLLTKNRRERITLEHVLEHPWIAKSNKKITELRRKSSDEGDKLLQFVAYTNTDINLVKQASPRRDDN
jgi:serine/threonine protein kinase